jgi:hypothetical protein
LERPPVSLGGCLELLENFISKITNQHACHGIRMIPSNRAYGGKPTASLTAAYSG